MPENPLFGMKTTRPGVRRFEFIELGRKKDPQAIEWVEEYVDSWIRGEVEARSVDIMENVLEFLSERRLPIPGEETFRRWRLWRRRRAEQEAEPPEG